MYKRQNEEASEDELIAFCKDNMAKFKRPKKVVFGSLPKTATGKIQKHELRAVSYTHLTLPTNREV